MHFALTILQVFASIAIVVLVLLQRGKGADAGAGFGAGASGTVFGARGARTALSRATAIFAAIFMLNSLALAYTGTRSAAKPASTLLDQASEPAQQQPAPAVNTQPAAPSGQAGVPAPAAPAPANGPQKP
jgi:preprotein translocase subunit SecG